MMDEMRVPRQRQRGRRHKYGTALLPVVVIVMFAVSLVLGTRGWIESRCFTYPRSVADEEEALRDALVETAVGWIGAREADGSHRPIIDLYNSHSPLARGYAVQYDDAWCSTFVSAAAIRCGLTDIFPTECGCEEHIKLFVALHSWVEDDDYIPLPGDCIFYSRKGDQYGENTGWADHVGIVVGVWRNWIKVVEGNYANAAAYRYIRVGDGYIRGFGVPQYQNVA